MPRSQAADGAFAEALPAVLPFGADPPAAALGRQVKLSWGRPCQGML